MRLGVIPLISLFVAMLSGERSGLKARLASAPLKLAFDGTVANRTSLMMEGTSTVDSPSLRSALRWMGQAPPGGGGGFGSVHRAGHLTRLAVLADSVSLASLRISRGHG